MDTTALVAEIGNHATSVGTIGMAVVGVVLVIAGFKWLKRAF